MKDATEPDDFYNVYDDKAAEAIDSFAYDIALPEPVAVAEKPARRKGSRAGPSRPG